MYGDYPNITNEEDNMSAVRTESASVTDVRHAEQGKSQLTKLYEIMRQTMDSGFYGAVEIKFEAGKVTIIRKTESIKI